MGHKIGASLLVLMLGSCLTFNIAAQTDGTTARSLSNYERKHSTGNATNEQVQATAVAIINNLVDKSERFEDQQLRAVTLARAADAIWEIDQKAAKTLFLKAWSVAETVDKQMSEKIASGRRTALAESGRGLVVLSPIASARSEVLGLATRRDPKIGEDLLKKIDDAHDDKIADGEVGFFDPTEPKLAIAKRLEVALELLNNGDSKQAKAFAEPALSVTTSPGIVFLCTLRQQEPEVADRYYSQLLAFAVSDTTADATTVSLLSSYVFTPTLLVTATRRGRVSNQFSDSSQRLVVSPSLKAAFFKVAATVLLRPIPPVSEDRTAAGRAGEYFTIARLLPLFQEGAPEYVPALNSQLAALANDTPESFKNGQESMLQLGLQSKGSEEDTVDKILAQVANAQSNSERDTLYVKAIRLGAQKSDQRIRRIADEVNDEKLRDSARSFADLVIVSNAINKKRVDESMSILREGRLTALHRVWAAAKIVGFLDPSDGVRALQLLDEGVRVAESMGQNDVQRSYAFACLAAAFLRFDRYRSWSLTEDAVKTANLVPNFTPDGGKLSSRLRTRNIIAMVNSDEPSFNLTNLFVLLSKEDLNLALSAAGRLKGDGPTASVNLAIARSMLERSSRGVSARK